MENECISILLCLISNSTYIIKIVISNAFCLKWGAWHFLNFIFKLYKFDTLNILGFLNDQDIKKKRKRVALTIENKLEVCKMVK